MFDQRCKLHVSDHGMPVISLLAPNANAGFDMLNPSGVGLCTSTTDTGKLQRV